MMYVGKFFRKLAYLWSLMCMRLSVYYVQTNRIDETKHHFVRFFSLDVVFAHGFGCHDRKANQNAKRTKSFQASTLAIV